MGVAKTNTVYLRQRRRLPRRRAWEPGLPTRPVFTDIDIDPETGKVLGLS